MGRTPEGGESQHAWADVDAWLAALKERLGNGDAAAVEDALAFLERDPYFFRSGYAREKAARWLARARLTPAQRGRAREVVLSTVDRQRHCPHPGVGRLARAVADNNLRRQLRSRLHDRDATIAWGALRMVASVRRPGLVGGDIDAARALVLANAARGLWLSPTVARLAAFVWSREWEAELRRLLPYHGPDRAAAKRLLTVADRSRKRRPGP